MVISPFPMKSNQHRHCEERISAFTRVFDALWGDEAIQSQRGGYWMASRRSQ
jgi:hypothetical protein